MGLGFDDDLVFLVHGGDAGVSLDDAFACGHLGRFVIGAVGEAYGAFRAFAIFFVLLKPGAYLLRFLFEPLQFFGFTLCGDVVRGGGVGFTMFVDDLLRSGLHFSGLALKVFARARFGLAGIGGKFYAINCEHLTSNQSLTAADQ